MTDPASIRFNNPGAVWGGNKIAKRWGATKNIILADGKNQGNTIAFFPTTIDGACAQFDLWRSSYCNLPLSQAISKWSGGNSSVAYMDFLCRKTGMGIATRITPELLAGPTGLLLLKAQAQWEAGRPYPMSDAEWAQAQKEVFAYAKSVKTRRAVVAASGTATVGMAIQHGNSNLPPAIFGVLAALFAAGLIWWIFFHSKGK